MRTAARWVDILTSGACVVIAVTSVAQSQWAWAAGFTLWMAVIVRCISRESDL